MIGMPFEMHHEDNDILDLVQDLADNRQWTCLREDDSFLTLTVPGHGGLKYDICMEWQDEFSSLLFACSLPIEMSDDHLQDIAARTLGQINKNLWLGHFDFSNNDKFPTFRYTFLFRLIPGTIAVEMIADVIDLAVAECNRFHSTFEMLKAGDVRLQDNLDAAVFETVGEA